MSPILQALGIDRMSIDDRIALVTAIWDSINEEPHPPMLSEAQRAELQRRLSDHNANPDEVVSWDQIKADSLARFKK